MKPSARDVVWVKVRGYPSWPAEIVPETSREVVPEHARAKTKDAVAVQFFGTRDFVRCATKDVKEWNEGLRLGFASKGKQKGFVLAVERAKAYAEGGEMSEDGWWSSPKETVVSGERGKKTKRKGGDGAKNTTAKKRSRGRQIKSDLGAEDALGMGKKEMGFVFPAPSAKFTTGRVEYQPPLSALCVGQPPPYERLHRSVFVSVPPPAKMHKNDSSVCDCVAPAGVFDANKLVISKKDAPKTGCGADCMNRQTRYSCDPRNCPCGETCSNRPLGQLPCPKTKIVRTLNRGWGLVLQEPVRAGDFIVEYAGEIIDERESAERLLYDKQTGEDNFYLMEISPNYVIDAKYKGSIARFINSSCHPNCETQRWVDAATGETRVGIFAIEDIPKGTELTYDYNFAHFGDESATSFVCMCGHPLCRGTLDASKKAVKNINRRLSVKLPISGKKRSKKLVARVGVIVDHDPVKNRYKVKLDDSSEIVSVVLDDASVGAPFKWLDIKPSKRASKSAPRARRSRSS